MRKKLFGLTYKLSQWKLFIILSVLILITVTVKLMLSEMWGYVGGGVLLMISCLYSLFKLNQRIDLKSVVKVKMKKRKIDNEDTNKTKGPLFI